MRQPSQRSLNIPPFLVMDVLERAQELERAGRSIIHMEIGEPDFETPEPVRNAAMEAFANGETKYTHSQGIVELREVISEHYEQKYGVTVDPGRIIVTPGTSPALLLIFAALLDEGGEVIMSDPHYACYPNFVSFLGGRPVYSPVYARDGYLPEPDDMAGRINRDTAAVLINSPCNPTGTVLRRDVMEKIAGMGIPVVSDEIYHGLVYGEKDHSILEFTDEAFVLNGFSKLYAMTGWRLGYLIAPKRFLRPIQKMQQNFIISAAAFAQRAGIAALRHTGKDIQEMVRTYDSRRQLLLGGLRETGFKIPVD
ncbi:MAG: pyridoxal phosphate-dependent aminotransferase, partial [Pseudomonadota bacterium]